MNPITIYLAHNIVDINGLANRFVGGPIKASLGGYAEALVLATVTAMSFLLVWFLHRKRILSEGLICLSISLVNSLGSLKKRNHIEA